MGALTKGVYTRKKIKDVKYNIIYYIIYGDARLSRARPAENRLIDMCTRARARSYIIYNNIIRVSGTRPSSIHYTTSRSRRTQTPGPGRIQRRLVFMRARARDETRDPRKYYARGLRNIILCNDNNDSNNNNNNKKKKSCVRACACVYLR